MRLPTEVGRGEAGMITPYLTVPGTERKPVGGGDFSRHSVAPAAHADMKPRKEQPAGL